MDSLRLCTAPRFFSPHPFFTQVNQTAADCPFEGVIGTGLEGWGNIDLLTNRGYYGGFTSNGYWFTPLGVDNHWTQTGEGGRVSCWGCFLLSISTG